ncbi:TPA: hypothetical protein L4G09_005856 [Pseudomonas aeruginosa]|nr:hypothetical protein [Pseudomonas aeruginosa]
MQQNENLAKQPEQAEAERPEVVGYRSKESGMVYEQDYGLKNPEALTTVAECDRIVGELRAENAKLIEALDESDGDRWRLRSERDAALARAAELEGKLAELEKPVPTHGEHSELRRIAVALKNPLLSGEEASDLMVRYEALTMPDHIIALIDRQAQHSVPDGYRLIRLEHFAAIKAQLNPEQVDAYRGRNVYDEDKVYANWNACRSALDEIKDVFQQIDWDAENELAELLAAAPTQAQHSVPEGWRIERSAERIVVMNLNNGAGYAAARDGESGIAESVLYLLAADLLAAAPGKEVGHE